TGYTYSGHPMGAVAVLKAVEIQEREGLLARATEIGARLESGLSGLFDDGLLVNVRGAGAVWGVTVPDGVDAVVTRNRLLDEGVIVRPLHPHLLMCPPLVTSDEQIDEMIEGMRNVLATS
ncbi:MAG: aminotransferase class III-fold pyridoxal phosphate-dependent enzyme, partial [Acidimicrobiia bacterium]